MTTELTIQNERRGSTSASNAPADALCAGRHLAQKGLTEIGSKDATHGQVVHDSLRTGDTSKLSVDQRDTYDACIAVEQKLVNALFPELAASKAQPKVWREERLWVKIKGAGDQLLEHSGKPDVVYRVGNKAAVFEYKTLSGEIPSSPLNLQLRDQAVLVHGNLLVPEVMVAVIQPLVTRSPEVCYYNAEDLQKSMQEMFARVVASNDPASQRVAGEVQCQYCLAKTKCPAYQKWAGAMVPNMASLLDVPIEAWSPAQRGYFMDRKGVAEKWLKDSTDAIKAGCKLDPDFCAGWTLKEGAKREKIIDPQGVFDRFHTLGGTIEQFMSCVEIGKTKLKEVLSTVTGARGKALEASVKTITDGLTESKQNEPSLERKVMNDSFTKGIE
jgi:hypothetical protein